jgi:hypothetical protein
LSFNSDGVSGSSYDRYSRNFCRICHFVSSELKLKYLSLWLDFLDTDVDIIMANPSAEQWIWDFRKIEVKERFDMKLGLRWRPPTSEELEEYEEELEDGMALGVDIDLIEERTAQLKELLTPTSLTANAHFGVKKIMEE